MLGHRGAGRRLVSGELAIELENLTLNMLGRAKKVVKGRGREGEQEDRRGRRQVRGDQGPLKPDPSADRGDHLRLRPREAAGAARKSGRRRRGNETATRDAPRIRLHWPAARFPSIGL